MSTQTDELDEAARAYLAQAVERAAHIPDRPPGLIEGPVNTAGVIGAGTMGGGIAMNMANVGIPVTLVETSQEALDRGLAVIRRNYQRSASRGRITQEEVEQRCALIDSSLELSALANCDLVIEAVFEDMAVKKDIFAKLDVLVKASAILASNTSALNLNEIAAATRRPESVIGLHFFSPANVMKLLEIVRGERTADDVIKTCMAFAQRINKIAVLVGVCPGFVGNRILFQRQAQAQQLILEGALPHQIDTVLRDFGFPMGPFQMSDLAGLDIGWNREGSKGETIRDCLCELDRRGQKTKAGYYDYDDNRKPSPSPVVEKLILAFSEKAGVTRREVSKQEILERCLFPMINEGAKILEEGIAIRASDIDVAWVYGYGWPITRGGPMYYANSIGLGEVVARMEHYAGITKDPVWQPCNLLTELARQGGAFT